MVTIFSVRPNDFKKSYSCRGDLAIIPRNEESVGIYTAAESNPTAIRYEPVIEKVVDIMPHGGYVVTIISDEAFAPYGNQVLIL